MHNMYLEMSKSAYTVDGQASPWITVPHSEGWYAASRCFQDETGAWVAGREQAMNGHPDNPPGAGRLATDAIDALAAATRASRGPTTTSRTRPTGTVTATSTSRTA